MAAHTFLRVVSTAAMMMVLTTSVIVIGTAAAAAVEKTECEKDANSYQCLIERDRTINEEVVSERRKAQSKDRDHLERLISVVDDLCNTWACAATGIPLYEAHGDNDVMNFAYTMLSQTLSRNGQQYGSELVTEFMTSKGNSVARSCDGIVVGDASHYNNLMEAILQLKSLVSSWLRSNEVDSEPVITAWIPQVRTLFGRWGIARLLVMKDANVTTASPTTNAGDSQHQRVPPEEVPLAVFPLLEGEEDSAEERCQAAGQLHVIYREAQVDKSKMRKLTPVLERLLDECYANGRISSHPVNYGDTLLDADREEQARELYDLAVQRGSLCNAFQRPDMLMRKDLTALPVWSVESYPPEVLRAILAVQDDVAEAVRKPSFVFSNDTESMRMFTKRGWWERTLIFSSHTWHDFNCQQFGNATCRKLHRLVDVITDANDAYATQCNGSLTLDIWRMSSDMTTYRSVGNTNIVLQLMMPVAAHRNSILLNVGEEAVKVDEGEVVLIDDSFENTLSVQHEAEEDDAAALPHAPLIMMHIQLCHPDFHERALELPAKKCKGTDRHHRR